MQYSGTSLESFALNRHFYFSNLRLLLVGMIWWC